MTVRGDSGSLGLDDDSRSYDLDVSDVFGEDEGFDSPVDSESTPRSGSRREGTDEILERLEASDPAAADALRGMQRRMSQSINQERQLSERLARLEGRLEAGGRQESGPEPPQPPEGVTEENLRLFQQMADFLGYVPRHEVQSREAERSSSGVVEEDLQRGVEMYGDSFGTVDESGRVVLNPDIRDRLVRRLELLQDPTRGVTPLDLYRLEFADGAQERRAEGENRRGARPRAGRPNVARRTSGGLDGIRIYDPRRGDSGDDVLDRAWALGKQRVFGG